MDLKKYVDSFCVDSDYEVVATGVPEPVWNPGLIYAPYIPITLTKPMDEYTAFMLNYNHEHSCCPSCGCNNTIRTLVAYILDLSKKEKYVDRNRASCQNCGWTGIVHELTPPKQNEIYISERT
jgi:hypothetical protein